MVVWIDLCILPKAPNERRSGFAQRNPSTVAGLNIRLLGKVNNFIETTEQSIALLLS